MRPPIQALIGQLTRSLQHLDLVTGFAIIGTSVAVLVALGSGWLIESQVTAFATAQLTERAMDQIAFGVLSEVTADELAPPYSPARLDQFGALLDARLARVKGERSSIIRLHLFARDGTIIYSDAAGKRGSQVKPAEVPLLAQALQGAVGRKWSALSSPESAELKARYGSALEVYVPVVRQGQVVAAYEIYQETSALQPIRPLVWSTTATGFVVLFLALLAVVRSAAHQLKQQQVEIMQRKDEAERANRAKSEFLSRTSHELRTPLNAILGFAQLLELNPLNDDDRESVNQILQGGRHLLALIDDLLDISRIESDRLVLAPEAVEVRALLEDLVELVRPLAVPQSVTVAAPCATAHGLAVLADRPRLNQVLLNLLSNAIKYNRPGGQVSITATAPAAGRVSIQVTDTGVGIAADKLSRLYTPFDRLGAEQTAVAGTGMGLALSKRLVEAMGGTIGVDSAVGRGSTFEIVLPEAEAVAALEAAGPRAPTTAASAGTVLYIEDNLANARLVARVLSDRPGLRLLTAMQGGLGLELARQHQPDLILLDLHLPDLPGQEVLRRLRAAPDTQAIPVVVISADATAAQMEALLAVGVQAYLTKPIDVRHLLGVLAEHVAA